MIWNYGNQALYSSSCPPTVGKVNRKTRRKSFAQHENAVKLKAEVLADRLMTVAKDVEKTRDKDMLMYAIAYYESALGSAKTKASAE